MQVTGTDFTKAIGSPLGLQDTAEIEVVHTLAIFEKVKKLRCTTQMKDRK